MARRLFLHIGMMKSGTTYVQGICNRNSEALEGSGIRWALGSYGRQASAYAEFNGSTRLMPGMEGSWEALRAEVASCRHDVLVSFELIADLGERRLRRFLHAFEAEETHVIVTARDLSRVLPSLWQESTQNRSIDRWSDFLKATREDPIDSRLRRNIDKHTDYAAVLRRWSTAVPVDNLHLVTVPLSSADPDELWHRFASVIDAPNHLGKPKRANETIGAVSSELMIRLNDRVQDLGWPAYRLGFKHGLAKQGLAARASVEPRMGFPADMLDWVQERAQHMVDDVVDLGVNVVGDLDDLVPRPAVGQVDVNWRPSDRELLEAALDGLESLGRQLGDVRLKAWKDSHGTDGGTYGGTSSHFLTAVRAFRYRLGKLRR
jgi:hypothetical protein